MSAIQATSAGVRDMADGSLRITLEFDPRYAKEAYALFGARGTSCAVAALTQAASKQAAQRETAAQSEKPGQLCVMACTFCADPNFWEFVQEHFDAFCENEIDAKNFVICTCAIDSRKELDTNHEAARIFLNEFRNPFLAWRDARRVN